MSFTVWIIQESCPHNTRTLSGCGKNNQYEKTKSYRKVNFDCDQTNRAKNAFSVCDGIVLEVYQIVAWLSAYSTIHNFKHSDDAVEKVVGCCEFVGRIADESIQKNYGNKMVEDLFLKGNQNPIKYIFHVDI